MLTPRAVTRRTFLKLAAATAGTAAIPSLIGTRAGAAGVTPRLLAGPEYPIGFWWPPPPSETTNARYAEIARAGFNFVTGGNGVEDLTLSAPMLAAADVNGLLAIPQDSRTTTLTTQAPADQAATMRAILNDYSPYDSFAGLLLYDEPSTPAFGGLAATDQLIRSMAPTVLPYINLLPTYATTGQLGAATYPDYLQDFLTAVDPTFLSFDHYTLLAAGGITSDYFYNWSQIRSASLQAGIPSWVFVLSVNMPGLYRTPTQAELYWQVNMSLSYGCKGIQWFTYWTPASPSFGQAMISVDGTEGPLYGEVQQVNLRYLRPVGRQLMPLVSESVVHANESPLPSGAVGFTPDQYVSAVTGSAVVVSRFKHPVGNRDQCWLLVANRAYDAAAQATVTFNPVVRKVFSFAPAISNYVPVRLFRGSTTVSLDPGMATLFRLATN